jgi:hypothetical protein
MKHNFKLKISNWTGFVKEATWFFQDYAKYLHSMNVSADIFRDKSNITLISMFAGELPKLQTSQYDRKKKDQVEISQPAIVSVYSRNFQNVDLLKQKYRGDFSLR